jgi:hypothetical protein
MALEHYPSATYPVAYDIRRPGRYHRLTVAFRLILAIPQLILVGGLPLSGFLFARSSNNVRFLGSFSNAGLLTAVLAVLTFFAWIVIIFTGRYPASMRDLCLMLFRWSQNVGAYMNLQSDPYPPFGDQPYVLHLQIEPAETYSRWTVAIRLILAIPHFIILWLLGIAQFFVTVIAWFAILFTAEYPNSLYPFSVGVSRWSARVAAYLYLFVDAYPPFSLDAEPGAPTVGPQTV